MDSYAARMPTAFNLRPSGNLVAIVGGGGKSSLMFALSRGLSGRIVLTTTTRIFSAQMKLAQAVCTTKAVNTSEGAGEKHKTRKQLRDESTGIDLLPLEELGSVLDRYNQCLVVADIMGDKALGVADHIPGRLLARSDVDTVIVEADGSRMRPCKAPASHEPVIPPEATHVIPVAGIEAVGGKISDIAHRPERVAVLTGLGADQAMTIEGLARLITHGEGGLKSVPTGALVIPLINKVETEDQLRTARLLASRILLEDRIKQVVIGAMRQDNPVIEVHRRVTAIVLAAGESRRMGKTKQLLPWGQTTVLGQVLDNLIASSVNDILVVTGHLAEAVTSIAVVVNVPTIHNPNYAAGEMLSSLQTAILQLPRKCSGILVVLADQPRVGHEVIDQILIAYWQGKGKIVAPSYKGSRGNPVLIDADYFEELLNLPPGSAPRELLRRHPADVHYIEVNSAAIIQDLDSPEQYERWRP